MCMYATVIQLVFMGCYCKQSIVLYIVGKYKNKYKIRQMLTPKPQSDGKEKHEGLCVPEVQGPLSFLLARFIFIPVL